MEPRNRAPDNFLSLRYQLNMKLELRQTIGTAIVEKHRFVLCLAVNASLHPFLVRVDSKGQITMRPPHNHNVFHKCKIRAPPTSYAHYEVIKGATKRCYRAR